MPGLDDDVPGVAIVGRPNVGKSTLFNRLIGDDRSVVHDMPGTTRDAIDTVVETDLGPIRFIDTAGMRRKAKVDDSTDYYSNLRALRAIDGADVALLVIDAQVGVTSQDQRLAERVDAAGCPIVLLMNKWETLEQEDKDAVAHYLYARELVTPAYLPILHPVYLKGGREGAVTALTFKVDRRHPQYAGKLSVEKAAHVVRHPVQRGPEFGQAVPVDIEVAAVAGLAFCVVKLFTVFPRGRQVGQLRAMDDDAFDVGRVTGIQPRHVRERLFRICVAGPDDGPSDAVSANALEPLVEVCDELDRSDFLLTMAPLRLKGGTGCPVNPIAVF